MGATLGSTNQKAAFRSRGTNGPISVQNGITWPVNQDFLSNSCQTGDDVIGVMTCCKRDLVSRRCVTLVQIVPRTVSPRWSRDDSLGERLSGERLSGGTSTLPQPRLRVRAQGNTVNPPKTPLSLVRMRPREFSRRVPTWMRLQVRLQI